MQAHEASRVPPGIDAKTCEVFLAVAEELHFGRAAARLGMTQPAVSRHLGRLEATLGLPLIVRRSRRAEMTSAGLAFADSARAILAALRRAEALVGHASDGTVGSLQIGVSDVGAGELAWRTVRTFRRRYPTAEALLSQWSHVTHPMAGIDLRRVDVAFVRAPLTLGDVRCETLCDEPRGALVGRGHPLAHAEVLTLGSFVREPVVTYAMWPKRLRDYWAGVDDGADVSYRVAVAARTVREWLQAISLGHGITLVPRSTASLFRGEAVRFIPMPALAPSRICLARRAEDERPMLRNFVAVAHWLGCGASQAFGLEGASIIDQHDPVGACH